jgi:hypothetical protein
VDLHPVEPGPVHGIRRSARVQSWISRTESGRGRISAAGRPPRGMSDAET